MITCVLGTNKKVLSLQSGYPIINKSGGGLIFEHQIILLYYQEFSTYYMEVEEAQLDHWVVEWLMKFYV